MRVFAGSINGTGALTVEVTTTAADNSLARSSQIVEAETVRQRQRATPRRPDRLTLGAGDRDRRRRDRGPGLPCSGTPPPGLNVPWSCWLRPPRIRWQSPYRSPWSRRPAPPAGSGTDQGGAALEALGRVRTVALDKTGTLTANRPPSSISPPPPARTAASRGGPGSRGGRRPGSTQRTPAGTGDPGRPRRPDDHHRGASRSGCRTDRPHRRPPGTVGRPGWIEAGPSTSRSPRCKPVAPPPSLVEHDGQLIGAVAVRDELRPESREVIDRLHDSGTTVAMLTGDNTATATALAQIAGIDSVHADLRPRTRPASSASYAHTGSPLWSATASTTRPPWPPPTSGIAMGAMGSDVAIETADIALMGDDLRTLPHARTRPPRPPIMLQNVALSWH